METLHFDTIVIGGGVAGLWIQSRLRASGYRSILLEKGGLGGLQSLRSQGIIHGGAKYSLQGALSTATSAIADMPSRWGNCFQGTGELDLRNVRLLSDHHYLWSPQRLGARITSFFASRALQKQIDRDDRNRPAAFDHPAFRGNFYPLREWVVDVPSLIHALAGREQGYLFQLDCAIPGVLRGREGRIDELQTANDTPMRLRADHYILAAGEGNAALLALAGSTMPAMQTRPLHMVLAKHQYRNPIYAHCIGSGTKPLLTITTHWTHANEPVWYIGGNIAEEGLERSRDAQIRATRDLLRETLPWIDPGETEWRTFHINRAEPKQSTLSRPDTAFVHRSGNLITAWPTKLALTPDLADRVLALLPAPEARDGKTRPLPSSLPCPPLEAAPWDQLF